VKPEDLAALPPARLPFPVTRALSAGPETTSTDAGMPTMSGHFSTFGDWYEVDSYTEGHFLERVAAGAFAKTIRKSLNGQEPMKVLYDHGQDPQIGNKVLGRIAELREDTTGPAYTVPLFDTSYNRDLAPGLIAGAYGSSFRFTVEKDEWDNSPTPSEWNSASIPERTITEARVYEFGPVTFPANPNATAGARSTTDLYYQRSRDPDALQSLLRTAQSARAPQGAAQPEPPPPDVPLVEPPRSDTPPVIPEDPPSGGSPDSRSATVDDMTIEEKRARRDELNEALKTQAEASPGELPEDEQVRFNTDVAERDTLKAHIAAWDARQAVLEGYAAKPENTERTFQPPVGRNQINRKAESELHSPESRSTTFEGRAAEFRDDAKRILEKTSFPHGLADSARSADKIADLLDHHDSPDGELARRVKFTSSPAYERAFHKFITSRGSTFGFTPEEQRGTALAVGVDATGGFTVPFAFDPTVIAIGSWSGAVNPYRRVCRVVNIVGTDTWNALTGTAVVATRTTEAAAAIEQGPTFAQPQYIVKRAQGQITASFEMFQDRTDLASEMAVLIQEAKDNEEEASWAVGAGATTASLGVGPISGTSGAYTAVAGGGSGVIAAADADLVEAALPVRHRFGAQWFMNRLNIRKFQTVETTGGKLFGGQQYQSVGIPELDRAGNTGLRLLGYAVNESPSLPVATTTTITIGTLLAPSSYVIVERIGMSVQFIPFILNSSALATGQQALYFMYRNHAAPLNLDAGRTLRFL